MWGLLDFLGDVLLGYWRSSRGPMEAYSRDKQRARERERVFSATQQELARQRREEASFPETDYFAGPPGKSS